MANHTFSVVSVKITSRNYNVTISPDSSTSDPYILTEGDTVTFTWTTAAGGSPGQLNFGNFESTAFTDASGPTLYSVGTSFTKTVKSGGTLPQTTNCRVSTTGSGFKYWYLTRVSVIDSTPDPINLGAEVVNANPYQTYYSERVTITGINTSITVSANNGASVSKNDGQYASSRSVVAGDVIRVKMTSGGGYATSKTITLTAGSGTATFKVTNMEDPGDGQLIPLGITSGTIKLSQIGDLFGRPQYDYTTVLSEYLKAPTKLRVPDISQNAGVPTGFPIKLTDFYGSATSFYVSTYPSNKFIDHDTTSAGGAFNLRWEIGVDWFLGYHPDVMNVAEFMYTFTQWGASKDAVLTSVHSAGTWHNQNTIVQIEVTIPTYVERRYSGQLTMFARHPLAPTKVVSATIRYWMDFYGP